MQYTVGVYGPKDSSASHNKL